MPRKPVRKKTSKTAGVSASRLVEKPATRTGRVPLTEVEDIVKRMLETQRYSPWFDTEEAARYLRKEPSTLRGWRSIGKGPDFHLVSGQFVRYRLDDLDAFVKGGRQAENPVKPPGAGDEK